MTPQELKASILQLAIQGKLVEQRPEEGTGGELLRDILTQRRRGAECAEKNSRAETPRRRGKTDAAASFGPACPVSPSCPVPPADAPFDIPESWVWVRLGEVASIERGSGIKRSETSQEGCPCVRYGEIYTSYGYSFTCTKSFVPESVAVSCHMANHGDVLCTLTGEWKEEIAKATAYLGKEPIAIGGDLAKISSVAFNPVLLVYFFFAPFMIQQKASKAKGTMIVHIGKEAICNLLIPLPPLAEQKRIVAKIEELLPLIDRYEKAWSKLEDFNKRFPVDMQKSLLQMAIQGKLVDQRPEEGTGEELYRQIQSEKQRLVKSGKIKKEKPLPEITPDEIPFEIPESWKWVRLGELCSIATGRRDANFGSPDGKYNFFTCAKNPIKCHSFSFTGESLLLAGNGDIGNITYFWGQFEAYQRTYVLQPYLEGSYLIYLYYHLQSNWVQYNTGMVYGTAIPYIRLGNVQNYLVALPPLAEQKRIVAKVEELMTLCKTLAIKIKGAS